MKNGFRPSKRVPIDPLERAEENARAYQDLARAEARRLPEYEPDDEEFDWSDDKFVRLTFNLTNADSWAVNVLNESLDFNRREIR